MNYKGIIVAGAIAIGLYLFSKTKKISDIAAERKTVQSGLSAVPPTVRQRTAQKIAQKIAQKVAQKRIGQPITQAARIAALRKAAARKAALRKAAVRKAAAQKIAQKIAQKVAQKVAPKRIGQPTTWAAHIAALRKAAAQKAAAQKAAAQKVGKKIGKTVAQKVVPQILEETGGRTGMALVVYLQKKAVAMHAAATQAANAVKNNTKEILPSSKWAGGRTGMALVIHLKRREEEIKRAIVQAKAAVPTTKLFSGAEKSTIIPYSESSKHSYYGPKSHKVLNEGYMEKRYKADLKQAEEDEMNALFAMFPEYSSIR